MPSPIYVYVGMVGAPKWCRLVRWLYRRRNVVFCLRGCGGHCSNLFPFRHSSKRDKSKQKRAKKSSKQPANTDRNHDAHVSEIGEGKQPASCASESGIKTDENILLQVFRRETAFYWYIMVLVWCYKIARKWGIRSRVFPGEDRRCAFYLVIMYDQGISQIPGTR